MIEVQLPAQPGASNQEVLSSLHLVDVLIIDWLKIAQSIKLYWWFIAQKLHVDLTQATMTKWWLCNTCKAVAKSAGQWLCQWNDRGVICRVYLGIISRNHPKKFSCEEVWRDKWGFIPLTFFSWQFYSRFTGPNVGHYTPNNGHNGSLDTHIASATGNWSVPSYLFTYIPPTSLHTTLKTDQNR